MPVLQKIIDDYDGKGPTGAAAVQLRTDINKIADTLGVEARTMLDEVVHAGSDTMKTRSLVAQLAGSGSRGDADAIKMADALTSEGFKKMVDAV